MAKKKNKHLIKAQESAGAQGMCRKATSLYVMAVFGLFPLVTGIGDYGYGEIVETKAWAWFILTAAWLASIAFFLLKGKREGMHIRFGWAQWTAAIFVLANALSACMSGRAKDAFFQVDGANTNSVIFIISYAAAFIGVSLFGKLESKHIKALAVSVSLSGVLSLVQLTGKNPLMMYPEGLNYYNKHKEYVGAFLGTMGNIDYLAGFLCFAVPILVVFALRAKDKKNRLLLIPAALSIFILYAIDVDAAKVGLLGGAVSTLPFVLRDKKAAKTAGFCCAAAVAAALAAVYFWPGQDGFLYEASQLLHGHADPSFGHDRVEIWMEAWKHVKGHLLLGNGPGSGAWLLLSIQKVNEKWGRVTSPYNVHNVYLGYLMEAGALALACYLLILWKGLSGWAKKRADDGIAALGAGVACFLIQDFFNLGLVTTAPLLWVSVGLLARDACQNRHAGVET